MVGFWGFKEVKVGDENMTPVAKWVRINKDNTFVGGNGWLQNSAGTWTYDSKTRAYRPRETQGTVIDDEGGAFTVNTQGDIMTWEREEEGMKVKVTLQKITQMPKSTADEMVGLWDLSRITKGGQDVTSSFDPDNKQYVFFRWDRVFMERTPQNERQYALWHINGHKPEVTIINHDKTKANETWHISVVGTELRMRGISDSNKDVEMVFSRISKFPQ